MKKKKIRGHKRRWKDIVYWVKSHKELDLEYLEDYQCDYAKIRIHPWSGISITNSEIPAPKRKTKNKILEGLIEIYDSWKKELDKLEEKYYLKIWLFEPRFSQSQVVCAIGERIDYYGNLFFKPEYSKEFKAKKYGYLKNKVEEFHWDYRFDEDHLDNSELGSPEDYINIEEFKNFERWFLKMMKKPHRTTKFKEPIEEVTELYSFRRGDVWLGEK